MEIDSINSSQLRGFVTGLVLGDGTIDKGQNKRAFRIKSINKDFIQQIQYYFNKCTTFKTKIKFISAYDDKYGVHHKSYYELNINAHPYFAKLYHYFYNDYRHRKIYSKTLSWLNPIGIANWYMSDGYVCLVGKTKGFITQRRVDICTDRYYYEDVQLIQQYFLQRWDIQTSIVTRNHTYRLRIQTQSYATFFNIILPYLTPSMLYKCYLGYTSKQNWMSDDFWHLQQQLQNY